jgi:Bifunctional DNA primase/polymerase, N-terminal
VPKQTERVDHLPAALAYASAGIAVFPLAPRSKVPLISSADGGHGLHDATTDLNQVREWWSRNRYPNIGLRTGVSLDAIDLDSESAIDALEQARAGREPVRGPVVKTGKGYHYLVRPTGLKNRAGVLQGVDFRGRNGLIVAPPSMHPNGQRYRWINPLGEGLYDAPSWLLELLTPQRTVNGSQELRVSNSSAYGRVALRRELKRVSTAQPGTRNDQLNRSAFALGQLVAIGALDEDETATTLIAEGQVLGLGVLECERTVASGMSAGMENPRSAGTLNPVVNDRCGSGR